MKRYKHKYLWWIAQEQEKPHHCTEDYVVNNSFVIKRELVENSTDWEIQEDKMLVPDEICFIDIWKWELALYFDKKSLWFSRSYNDWCIWNFNTSEAKKLRLDCELKEIDYDDIEVWDWIVCRDNNEKIDLSEIDRYWLVIWENWLKARVNNDDWIVTRKRNYNRQNYYKVHVLSDD